MKISNVFIISYVVLMIFLFIIIGYAIRSRDMQADDVQRHLVEQPAKPALYIIDSNDIFERDGFLYYEIGEE